MNLLDKFLVSVRSECVDFFEGSYSFALNSVNYSRHGWTDEEVLSFDFMLNDKNFVIVYNVSRGSFESPFYVNNFSEGACFENIAPEFPHIVCDDVQEVLSLAKIDNIAVRDIRHFECVLSDNVHVSLIDVLVNMARVRLLYKTVSMFRENFQ